MSVIGKKTLKLLCFLLSSLCFWNYFIHGPHHIWVSPFLIYEYCRIWRLGTLAGYDMNIELGKYRWFNAISGIYMSLDITDGIAKSGGGISNFLHYCSFHFVYELYFYKNVYRGTPCNWQGSHIVMFTRTCVARAVLQVLRWQLINCYFDSGSKKCYLYVRQRMHFYIVFEVEKSIYLV